MSASDLENARMIEEIHARFREEELEASAPYHSGAFSVDEPDYITEAWGPLEGRKNSAGQTISREARLQNRRVYADMRTDFVFGEYVIIDNGALVFCGSERQKMLKCLMDCTPNRFSVNVGFEYRCS